jgi:hypothetical protein
MPRIKYQNIKLGADRLAVVEQANRIIAEYEAQGFDLTLRQLYYQFVSRDLIANKQSEYKRLGDIVNDGRMAGLIDWNSITDRTRNLRSLSHWDDPADIIKAAEQNFRIDKWATQEFRPEVWIEKDALVGILESVCPALDVPYFSCRGYTSQSEMWGAAQRLLRWRDAGQRPVILHLGDHDPSGCDMSRDIRDRLELFTGDEIIFDRLALNMPQIEEYGPPPNPAKLSDSRCQKYIQTHGDESWELDALDPAALSELIRTNVEKYRDAEAWDKAVREESRAKKQLTSVSDRWPDVSKFLRGKK